MSRSGQPRRRAYLAAFLGFVVLALVALLVMSGAAWLQGFGLEVLQDPLGWLERLDPAAAASSLSSAAELVANVVAIAITVVAIIVELAANRYSHRITRIFVTEPINVIVMSLFIITAVTCVWNSAPLGESPPGALVPNAGFGIAMVLVTLSLLALLPYFAFVFAFLSPTNIISKISASGLSAIASARRSSLAAAQGKALMAVDELHDVARRATEVNDRAVAMASLDALSRLLVDYQALKDSLPDAWFEISSEILRDPDFVSLAPLSLEQVEEDRMWLEFKIMRQYLATVMSAGPTAKDVINLIAIKTRRLGELGTKGSQPLADLSLRCFNSYLRSTINNGDLRSSYYVMNEYRQLGEAMMAAGDQKSPGEIALHLQYYAILAFKYRQPFLLEVAAYDLVQLITSSLEESPDSVDDLLQLLLDLDQEVKTDWQAAGNLGVRRAQLQLATLFLERGDEMRCNKLCEDLRGESREVLTEAKNQLLNEDRSQFWEITDRGVNFIYLDPARRKLITPIFERIYLR